MERKLAAIFSADVQGYSRLMGDDEEATIRTLTVYREVMTNLIEQHHGRVVDSPGDNLLAEFASAVDAVQGAVAIQQELKARNADLPDHRQMHYRIGINIGDIVVEGERIYGDGVNIAARIESLAEGGGIAISGTVYDQVKNKLPIGYAYQGEQTVKNIADPVRMYKVERVAEAVAPPASGEPPAELPLPDKPSIAVLPFSNMSSDPEQEYFSDGMTEDLITDLSQLPSLFVIVRNSTFTYKGQAVEVGEVGRRLGVRYVLEGSVRKAGNRIRTNVQLIDAPTGGHVWAKRYDRELHDIFDLQDEVTHQIVAALKVTLSLEEQERLERPPTANVEAYDYYLRGVEAYYRYTPDANAQACQWFERAIELDPQFAGAYAWLGVMHWQAWAFQWHPAPDALDRALELVRRAVTLDETLAAAHRIQGWVTLWRYHEHERAITELEQAVALDPNYADGYAWLGETLRLADRPMEAQQRLEQARRLNPHYPVTYLFFLGNTYCALRQYEEAIRTLKRAVIRNPDFGPAHNSLAWAYSELGRVEEACAEGAEILRINPHYSVETDRQVIPFKDPEERERWAAAQRKAGLK